MRLINETDFSILDVQCRRAPTPEVTRQHPRVDQIHLVIESRNDLAACLWCVPNNDSGDAECFRQVFDLRTAFCIRPLRVASKPKWSVLLDREPGTQSKKSLQRLGVFSLRFIERSAGGRNQLFLRAARLGDLFID